MRIAIGRHHARVEHLRRLADRSPPVEEGSLTLGEAMLPSGARLTTSSLGSSPAAERFGYELAQRSWPGPRRPGRSKTT